MLHRYVDWLCFVDQIPDRKGQCAEFNSDRLELWHKHVYHPSKIGIRQVKKSTMVILTSLHSRSLNESAILLPIAGESWIETLPWGTAESTRCSHPLGINRSI